MDFFFFLGHTQMIWISSYFLCFYIYVFYLGVYLCYGISNEDV